MIPYKAITRDRMIQVATELGNRIRQTSLELSRLDCYHEILEKDLYSTIIGDNSYWQKGSLDRNHTHKHLSHIITTREKHHNKTHLTHSTHSTSDEYIGGDVDVKHRPVTMGMFE